MTTDVKENYFDLGGTIRSCPPEKTLQFVTPFLEKFGITRVANVTGLDTLGIPVAICIRPNAKHLSVSQGKGVTWELAQTSAIMESMEGYHAENPKSPDCYGAYADLVNKLPALSPNLFNRSFFQTSDLEKMPLHWILAFDLTNQKEVFIPHILVSLDSTKPNPEYSFFAVTSNGLASGNTREEAILHGLCEVIERDSLCRWAELDEAACQATQVNLATITSPINCHLIEKFEKAGLKVKIWDIASELGIPAFHCALQEKNSLRSLGTFCGTGAHLSKEVALARALTEAAQSRLTLISGSRDDVFLEHYQKPQPELTPEDAENPAPKTQGTRDFATCPAAPQIQTSFAANIDFLVQHLNQAGFPQALMVDHTKPEFNIPVVHVFIPCMVFSGARI